MSWIATFGVFAHRVFAAALFIVGAVTCYYGWRYGLGHLNDVGPGAFPFGLGILFMVFSALAGIEEGDASVRVRIAPVIVVPIAIAAWAMLIERTGLLVATIALIGLGGLASSRFRPIFLLLLALALTAAGYIIFVLGFNLPLMLFRGP